MERAPWLAVVGRGLVRGPYTAEAQTNPQGPSEGAYRVLRGGSFFGMPSNKLSSGHRFFFPPEAMLWNFGFRCARD